MAICPICKQEYTERPALSRKDNKTLICPKCGTKEALEYLPISEETKEQILAAAYSKEEGKA